MIPGERRERPEITVKLADRDGCLTAEELKRDLAALKPGNCYVYLANNDELAGAYEKLSDGRVIKC